MLASPGTREASRTVLLRGDAPGTEEVLRAVLGELESDTREAMRAEGADVSTLSTERSVDARYHGQSFELGVPAEGWVAAFHRAHRERYGYERRDTPLEAVTLRVVLSAAAPVLEDVALAAADGPPATAPSDVVHGGRIVRASRVRRSELRSGHELAGPAVVEEYSATTWVPPEWRLRVDARGCLHLTPDR
jgi:N-methylhydantoinase A